MSAASDLGLITDANGVSTFFKSKLEEGQDQSGIKLSETVEFYLLNLLVDSIRVREKPQVFSSNGDPVEGLNSDSNELDSTDCLALMLKRALESSPSEQVGIYKQMADTALYFSGFFQEYFFTKSFDVGYYVTMGTQAYGTLASLMKNHGKTSKSLVSLYSDMSREFLPAVDVLTYVSGKSSFDRNKRTTLEVYDAWLGTASKTLERELYARGIVPTKVSKRRN